MADEELPSLAEFAPDALDQTIGRVKNLYDVMATALDVEAHMNGEERRRSERENPTSYEEWEHLIFDEVDDDLAESRSLTCQMVIVGLNAALERQVRRSGLPRVVPEERKKPRDVPWTARYDGACAGAPSWNCVKEIALARNEVMHAGKRPPKPSRYVNDAGEASFDRETLEAAVADLREFAGWLHKRY